MPDDIVEPTTDPPAAPAIDPNDHAAVVLENTLLRAGVDLESVQGQLVRSAWEGKAPDLEAIKTQWELVKPVDAPPPLPPEEQRIDGEATQAAERGALNANSVVEPNPEDTDPREDAVKAGIEVLAPPVGRVAGTREDAQAAVVHTLLEAAARGDGRVLVQEREPAR